MNTPLTAPATQPAATPASVQASSQPGAAVMPRTMRQLDREMTAPAERSSPPRITARVSPIAPIASVVALPSVVAKS